MRRAALFLAVAVAACASKGPESPQIRDLTKDKSAPPSAQLPVVQTGQIEASPEKALANYEELLNLPQDPVSRRETLRRLADLQLELDEQGGGTLEESEQRLRRSVALYDLILREHPEAPGNDRVLYQLGRAYQNLGEIAKAESTLERMTQAHPQSAYSDDARFRRAELLFRLGRFDEAAAEYRHVMERKDATGFFELAQYKYGWSMYKLSNFNEALDTFLAILQREMPPHEISTEAMAVAAVNPGKKDLALDALRVVSLSFANLGGGDAANRYFEGKPQPPFLPLLYNALGQTLLDKERYTDAAKTWVAFIDKHPRHTLAPEFQARAIEAQSRGGFVDLVAQEKERYVRAYDPAAPYWSGRNVTPAVREALRVHLEDLARHYQAAGQKKRDQGAGASRPDFLAAARWYRRVLELYPQDPKGPELRLLLGEALYDGGETLAAATEFNKLVAEHPGFDKAPDAAYAAVLAYQRHGREVPDAQKTAAMRNTVRASLQLAERFPQHPKALAALTRAAEELYQLQSYDEALGVASRVLKAAPPAPDDLRRTAWGVTADIYFSQKRYAQAETSYAEVLRLTPADAAGRNDLQERLAASIYKQGEEARAGGNLRGAADAFLRVGKAVPAASIRATAEYDAAAMLITLKDWARAGAVLEAFRATHAGHPLLPDVDKKLVTVYQSSGRPREAAAVLRRIAGLSDESEETRRESAWRALQLLEQANDANLVAEYEAWLKQNPEPLDRAQDVRSRLADLAGERNDESRRLQWLRETLTAHAAAGSAATAGSAAHAARAALELGRAEARAAARIALRLPLKDSLPRRRQVMERAIGLLTQASDFGIAEITTAATYELGLLYADLSRALLDSDRPARLSELERDQYNLLLEEQAFPFEEKSIEWHEANLQRARQGHYDPWVGRSLEALAQLAPGQYGKAERATQVYDEFR